MSISSEPGKPVMKTAWSTSEKHLGQVEQTEPGVCTSSPELNLLPLPRNSNQPSSPGRARRVPRDGVSSSESQLISLHNETANKDCIPIEQKLTASGDQNCEEVIIMAEPQRTPKPRNRESRVSFQAKSPPTCCTSKARYSQLRPCSGSTSYKISKIGALDVSSPMPTHDTDPVWARQMRDMRSDMRSSARIIKDSRARLMEIQKKGSLTDCDAKELKDRHELLLREMERFDRLTRNVQRMVDSEVTTLRKYQQEREASAGVNMPIYPLPDAAAVQEMENPFMMCHGSPNYRSSSGLGINEYRCRSDIDLTRKLSESYDMQEKLVADNADLEVKRYILYKELMTKDQNLETCRAQNKRLQDELKMMSKENTSLHERLSRNNPEGDATATRPSSPKQALNEQDSLYSKSDDQLALKLESFNNSSADFFNQLHGLETEVRTVRIEMDSIKLAAEQMSRDGEGPGACRTKGGKGPCYTQPSGAAPPPMMKACGICPPCPAPCNPNAPPTPAEREVAKLTIQLRQTEENFKVKVTECAMLRSELMKKKEELEKERCQHREVKNKLRELEMKFEGLQMHTNMMLGTKEEAYEVEVNVRALKQCYREAKDEIEELRTLLREQNEQLQDYRVKYMQAQQLVEEQKRQMDMMDLDNNRISEQINLEIQKVKVRFQEKLQELSPLPDLLKATQMRLKDAQQSQALAEHNAEQLARELNIARERVHILMHNLLKPAPDKKDDKGAVDEKQIVMLSQRISQLTEINQSLKQEIERLKTNVIRMEEAVLQNERRLQEKMHECAQLGGELDRTRDECARALQRANERNEVSRKCLQNTIAELERQLAACRAKVKTADKEREELQNRMTCQIQRLNDNFEQAQLRILGLTTQVATLRHNASSNGGGDDEEDDKVECQCKTLFNDP